MQIIKCTKYVYSSSMNSTTFRQPVQEQYNMKVTYTGDYMIDSKIDRPAQSRDKNKHLITNWYLIDKICLKHFGWNININVTIG